MADTVNSSQEVWKDVPFNKSYQVSNMGRAKSFKRGRERLLKPGGNPKGYLYIALCEGNKPKTYSVHRLIMLSFVGKSGLSVDHINGIKGDNRLENLEYVTAKENSLRGGNCTKKRKGASSKYIGVHSAKNKNLAKAWRASSALNGRQVHIGCFETELQAHEAYVNYRENNNLTRYSHGLRA